MVRRNSILSGLIASVVSVSGAAPGRRPPSRRTPRSNNSSHRGALVEQAHRPGRDQSEPRDIVLAGRVHDAQIQAINIKLNDLYDPAGKPVPWRDDYRHNIAAYKLDRLLRLNMVPPSVERTTGKLRAAFTWWVDDVAMMESDRERKKIEPPDPEAWKKQLSVATTFDQLIYNVDRNTGNLLITKDWTLVLIDHTRRSRQIRD